MVDGVRASASAHLGGGLAFLADGSLLLGAGDGAGAGFAERLQDPESLSGKILRLNPDSTNEGRPDDLVWAMGLRNPFRIATTPDGERVLAADVGSDAGRAVEELTLVAPGENHGWPHAEGPSDQDGYTDPILWYRHSTGCRSIIGGSFLPAKSGASARYAFGDFVCGKVWIATLDGDGVTSLDLVAQLENGVSSVRAASDGSIYVTSTGPTGPESSTVQRIVPEAAVD